MYSQNQEELIIKNFFESPAGNLKSGVVLDIGANDGETLSNSRYLIQKGWDGVLVEPDPVAAAKLAALYPWDKNSSVHPSIFGAGIADQTGHLPFYSTGNHLGKGDTGLLSTFNLDELKSRFPGEPYTETIVPVITWEDFYSCRKADPIPRRFFDFISIDAEGYDLKILKQIDFNETKTKLVCVEWNSKDRHLYDQVMYPFGFRLIHLNGENLIYGR